MAKIAGAADRYDRLAHNARTVSVHAGRDREVAAALKGSGGPAERYIHQLALGAETGATVYFQAADVPAIAEDLAALLHRAREAGHPAAGKIAAIAAQLGHQEPGTGDNQHDDADLETS